MTAIEAIILGLVEGLTEYLPVSSTGHLIIARYLLDMGDSDALRAFDICIQSGAILAVVNLYFARMKQITLGLLGKDRDGLILLRNIIIAFLPALVFGLLFNDLIKSYLFGAPVVTASWAIGGIVILLFVRYRKKSGKRFNGKELEEMNSKQALSIGLMQCVAMCPGTSRSLMTMLGGLISGMSMAAAVEFSFLLGLITLGAATVHDAWKYGDIMVEQLGWGPIALGIFTAWLSAIIAVKWMVDYLKKHSLSIFGVYRIIAAIVMLGFILHGLR